MPKQGIARINVSVADLASTRDFFLTQMNMIEVTDGAFDEAECLAYFGVLAKGAEYAMLKTGESESLLMLISFDGIEHASIREGANAWDYGYFDLAFRSKDNAAAQARFEELGLRYLCPPVHYTADWINLDVSEGVLNGPDDIPIALIQRMNDPIAPFELGEFGGMTDCAHVVEDMEEAKRFYESLGMKCAFDGSMPDGLINEIVGVPLGTDIRIAMFVSPGAPVTELLEYSIDGDYLSDRAHPKNTGIYSTAYEVESLNDALQAIGDAGFRIVMNGPMEMELAPYGKVRSVQVMGPSELCVELFEVL